MKAADLRKAILQYAVEGKLVPQDNQDEPASILYEKIIVEKENLIKQGKIKKEKPLPPITDDEIPYDIPENWKWVRLGEVCDVRDGTHDTPKYISNGIPLITSKNISNNTILFDNVKYISSEDYRAIANRSFVDTGDILFAMIGSIGNPVIVNTDKQFAIKNVALFKFHQNHFFYNKYLLIFLQLNQYIMQKKSSGAVQSFVSLKFLREYLFPLPPLKEQERIVKKIDELMGLCDKLEQEEEKLLALDKNFMENLPKSILQYAVEGKLVLQDIHDEPASILYEKIIAEKENLIKQGKIKKEKPLPPITDDDIPYNIPENWKWVRLGEICNLSIGKTPERKTAEYWKDGIYNWVAISDMINGGLINQTKEKISQIACSKVFKKNILPIGTLLFSFKLTIGKLSLLNIPAYTNEAICAITPYLYDNIKYYLLKILPILNLLDNANDAIKGKTLNLQTLPLILVPLPPLKEQERIVKKVNELLIYCNKLKDIFN